MTSEALSVKQAAEWMGVSNDYIRARIADGSLPAAKPSPRITRILKSDLIALFETDPSKCTPPHGGTNS